MSRYYNFVPRKVREQSRPRVDLRLQIQKVRRREQRADTRLTGLGRRVSFNLRKMVRDPRWDHRAANFLDDPHFQERPWEIPPSCRVGLKIAVVAGLLRGFIEQDNDWRVLLDGSMLHPAEERSVQGERIAPLSRPRFQKGYIDRRGKTYRLRFREDTFTADGKVHRIYRSLALGPLSGKKAAQRAAESILRPFNSGARHAQVNMTLAEFWSGHFEPQIMLTLKPSTQKMYRSLYTRHLAPHFGQNKLSAITRAEVQRFIGLKRQRTPLRQYATETLGHLRDTLSKILSVAVDWGWLEGNVARGVKLPPAERRRTTHILISQEIEKLLAALPEPSHMIVGLGVATGLRIGELLGLQLADLDLNTATVYVRRAVYRGTVGTPKTPGSERAIPLPSFTVEMLRDYLSRRTVDSPWLFPNERGGLSDDRNLMRRQIEPTSDRLKIARFGWHSLRHTFSTIAGNAGVPLPLLQSLLGHTTLTTTLLYTHPVESSKREAMERVAGVLHPFAPSSGVKTTGGSVLLQ